ncbi:hypothetical protein pb186bvf_015518 [Paramecium bursaria]
MFVIFYSFYNNIFQSIFNFNIILQLCRQKTRSRLKIIVVIVYVLLQNASRGKADQQGDRYNKLWSPHENQMLLNLYEKHNGYWEQIAIKLLLQIQVNASRGGNEATPIEDQQVVRLATFITWKELETNKERFLNNLDRDIRKENKRISLFCNSIEYLDLNGLKYSKHLKEERFFQENYVKNPIFSYIKHVYLLQQKSYDDENDQSDQLTKNIVQLIEKSNFSQILIYLTRYQRPDLKIYIEGMQLLILDPYNNKAISFLFILIHLCLILIHLIIINVQKNEFILTYKPIFQQKILILI